jgi:competence protein ComGC
MKEKAFTLIEMLGIVTILGIILLISLPTLNRTLKSMKVDQTDNLEKNIAISAEAYIELNRDKYPELDEEQTVTITVKDLYDANLLKGNQGIDMTKKIIFKKDSEGIVKSYLEGTDEYESVVEE